MRIKSNFHDYYDSVQAYGQDDLLYLRKPVEVKLEKIKNYPYFSLYTYNRFCTAFKLKNYVIGFCNKIYLCLELQKYDEPPKIAYTFEEIKKFIESNYKEEQIKHLYSKKYTRDSFSSSLLQIKFKKYQEILEQFKRTQDNYKHLFEKYPIFVIYPEEIIFNDCLKEFEFWKIFDSFSAFQEIAMFLSNQAVPMKPIPHISDEVMVGIKGFDKFSFRKAKQKQKNCR